MGRQTTARAHIHTEREISTRTRKKRDSITHEHTDGEGGTAHALTHEREKLERAHMDRKSSTCTNTHQEHTQTHT